MFKLKKLIVPFLITALALLTAGCSSSTNNSSKIHNTSSGVQSSSNSSVSSKTSSENSGSSVVSTVGSVIPVNKDLSIYSGEWVNSEQRNESSGGTYLTIKTDKEGNTSGSVTSARANTSNIAEVDFKGNIKNGSLIYNFSDDGWGHSGTVTLSFNNGEIVCNITVTSGESSLWSIQTGTFKFIKKQ